MSIATVKIMPIPAVQASIPARSNFDKGSSALSDGVLEYIANSNAKDFAVQTSAHRTNQKEDLLQEISKHSVDVYKALVVGL
ncbi:MAG: hypothetical protein HQL69_16695 [Magnetococcales bacterium]|nr:hypothetical protein [Magnetococcales bacterium]